jgi:hypothetical protein
MFENLLEVLCSLMPNQMVTMAPFAEFWYNTSYHSSLGQTLFKVLYGHDPIQMGIGVDDTCQNEDLQKWLKDKDLIQ